MNKTDISPAEYLKKRIKVFCHNRNQWETDELTILESGDFIDRKNRVHLKRNHTAYVTLDDALNIIRIIEERNIKKKNCIEKLKEFVNALFQ